MTRMIAPPQALGPMSQLNDKLTLHHRLIGV